MKNLRRILAGTAVAVVTVIALTSCALSDSWGDSITRAFQGVPATMRTYDNAGQQIDQVTGQSFRISRDTRFDTTDSSGDSNDDSEVLMISLGSSHISHVGASLVLAQDGLTDISADPGVAKKINMVDNDPGTPWINDLLEYNRNLWHGKGKTIMIRSQYGNPIAVFAGNEVEIEPTDVPKSTWFRVDGKYLFVYRADYTVYDNDLLSK